LIFKGFEIQFVNKGNNDTATRDPEAYNIGKNIDFTNRTNFPFSPDPQRIKVLLEILLETRSKGKRGAKIRQEIQKNLKKNKLTNDDFITTTCIPTQRVHECLREECVANPHSPIQGNLLYEFAKMVAIYGIDTKSLKKNEDIKYAINQFENKYLRKIKLFPNDKNGEKRVKEVCLSKMSFTDIKTSKNSTMKNIYSIMRKSTQGAYVYTVLQNRKKISQTIAPTQ
jgi:hypothetical protein